MLRNRFLVLLGVCVLGASGAWADEVGYIDCSNHSDATQVFGKPRKGPDVVASLPCGERFTILVYGFYFSRIQTSDGQIGYIYSNLIAVDRGATASQQGPSLQVAAEKTKIPSTRALEVKPSQPALAPPQSAPAQQAPANSAAVSAPAGASSTTASPETASASTVSSPTGSSASEPATSVSATAATSAAETQTPVAQAEPSAAAAPAPAQPQPALAQPAPAAVPDVTPAAAGVNPPETSAPAQPESRTAAAQPAQPEATPAPAPAKPAPAIRPADTRETWERPNPSVRRAPLLELFGGYGYARIASGGTSPSTNLNGAVGSVGYNLKPWLQIVGDSSYSFVTVSGVKNVLYGNHYGARYYYHSRNRWSITPFAEALVGGSRADTTITGTGGYTTSQNSLSFKVGGGLDFRPSRRWEVRLFDADYYRTSFGTNAHQNNYWISTGVVLRLFGGRTE